MIIKAGTGGRFSEYAGESTATKAAPSDLSEIPKDDFEQGYAQVCMDMHVLLIL